VAADISSGVPARVAWLRTLSAQSDADVLRAVAIIAGLGWALVFPILGVRHQLQMYGDGALFSYAVAAQNAWAFHWHNISGRVFVYVVSLLPAELYVGLTGDARGGIALYGFLFFVAPLAGLAATWALDRSPGKTLFAVACASTAFVCPLVFGFPTEMWIAHAVFWPALAASHYAREGPVGFVLVLALMLALVLSHEGALILAATILATMLLPGTSRSRLRRGGPALLFALLVWGSIKLVLRPDPYIADVLASLAMGVFDLEFFSRYLLLLLFAAVAAYTVIFHVMARLKVASAHIVAFCAVSILLVSYWLLFDGALHAEERYYLRTAVILLTPLFGALAAGLTCHAAGLLDAAMLPVLPRLLSTVPKALPARAAACIILLVTLIHAVETAKFVSAWADYRHALQELAAGRLSDPELGDTHFVSAGRIVPRQARLAWPSTTPFLAVLVSPDLTPTRLVVAPDANFFWVSCETLTASAETSRGVPRESQRLLRRYSCLHRIDGDPRTETAHNR